MTPLHNLSSTTTILVTPVRTFRVEDGRWCREYLVRESLSGRSEARRAVACREPKGRWTTQLVILEES